MLWDKYLGAFNIENWPTATIQKNMFYGDFLCSQIYINVERQAWEGQSTQEPNSILLQESKP